jgi:hypothetical protein
MSFPNPFGGVKVYVSPPGPGAGSGDGTGTFADPYHSIATGIENAAGGGTVYLRAGNYQESVAVTGVSGTWLTKIVIRPYESEQVTVDALIAEFLHPPDGVQWDPVGGGEYVWSKALPAGDVVTGGAFMDRDVHTRLVSYSRLEDLQSTNELWPKGGSVGDNFVWERHKDTANVVFYTITKERRRWVYMGPGIWFDPATRKVHIKLAATHNNLDDWQDYEGETDPNQLRLALSEQNSHALFLRGCSHIRFKNLTMRYGGQDTIRLRNCCDITFDHVNIRAASRAIRLQNDDKAVTEKNIYIVFKHCEIDGGLPPWFFRTDRKDTYYFDPANNPNAPTADIRLNRLGASTGGVLISGGRRTSHVTVRYCEIFNGHDAYVFGDKMSFHHNLVRNLNDDGLAVSGEAGPGTSQIYQNVITQCMTVPSFGADTVLGHTYFYRNLVDLRMPTAGIRPAIAQDPRSLRNGHFYKGDAIEEGPFDLFHNTCLVLDPGGIGKDDLTRGFAHYSGEIEHGGQRRAYNNIFVAAYTGRARELAFLPPAAFNGPTDGNTYFRIPAGPGTPDSDPNTEFLFLVRTLPDGWTSYETLDDYRVAYWSANPDVAYEKKGTLEDPQFQSFAQSGLPAAGDDLRIQSDSPAHDGAPLPIDLLFMDLKVRGILNLGTRDRGCYRFTSDRLRVGVDGREVFPPL